MKKLNELIKGLNIESRNCADISILHITTNSKKVKHGSMFIAIKGSNVDGNEFIKKAIKNGAVCILTNDNNINKTIPSLISNDLSKDIPIIAKRFFDFNEDDFRIIGITGTNGKTTISYILKMILEKSGKTGLIGTIRHMIGEKVIKAINTTPDSVTLYSLLNEMEMDKVKNIVMEVSSHGLALNRIFGIRFDSTIFSNFTQDHIDFHKTMDNYKKSKLKLFSMLKSDGNAIINADDKNYKDFLSASPIKRRYTLGLKNKNADWLIHIKSLSLNGSSFDLENTIENKKYELKINIVGDYNIYNVALAFISAYYMGIDGSSITDIINKSFITIPGRFERFNSKKGFTIIVDYAHTPDALANVLKTLSELKRNRLICVFGTGGERDTTKRPEMLSAALEFSDLTIITNDNPRNEDPSDIIRDIVGNTSSDKAFWIIRDREQAIKTAICNAQKGDIVLLAG
ncbi:UDP-N-acetylmuramoyl-L-alanyl-D-glutamate--2,6-diaminopimelate ligase, partial [candidate division WOR-3 bacterium]|nr:UDP-N-acetylmuramoyl-L-alanyl-D-glutamate--2,6-diaminopimelate ligase [candidate division WOR-3 bacterium]